MLEKSVSEYLSRFEAKKALKLSVSSLTKLHFIYLHPLRAANKRIYYRLEEVRRVAFLLGKNEIVTAPRESVEASKPAA